MIPIIFQCLMLQTVNYTQTISWDLSHLLRQLGRLDTSHTSEITGCKLDTSQPRHHNFVGLINFPTRPSSVKTCCRRHGTDIKTVTGNDKLFQLILSGGASIMFYQVIDNLSDHENTHDQWTQSEPEEDPSPKDKAQRAQDC